MAFELGILSLSVFDVESSELGACPFAPEIRKEKVRQSKSQNAQQYVFTFHDAEGSIGLNDFIELQG